MSCRIYGNHETDRSRNWIVCCLEFNALLFWIQSDSRWQLWLEYRLHGYGCMCIRLASIDVCLTLIIWSSPLVTKVVIISNWYTMLFWLIDSTVLNDSCSQYDLYRDSQSIHRSSAATAGVLSLFVLVYFRNCDTRLILMSGVRGREQSSESVSRLDLEVNLGWRRRLGSCDVNRNIEVRVPDNIWISRLEFAIKV